MLGHGGARFRRVEDAVVEFDLDQVDHLLSTTRAVRRRLDLDRSVPDELLLRCIDLAEQAPSGGNQTNRRWLVIRDPETKSRLADLYREVGVPFLRSVAAMAEGMEGPEPQVFGSSLYLAENLERVPVLVVVTIQGLHDGSGRPGLYDSVLQSAWSFCLAARSRGLGTAWTTLHLNRATETAELLGIPDDFTQVVLFPVAWTTGGEFKPVARRPAAEITYFDQWGFTRAHSSDDGDSRFGARPAVTVETRIAASPERVWDLLTDLPGGDTVGIEWEGNGPPGLDAAGTATERDPERILGWSSGHPDERAIHWRLTLEPALLPGPTPQSGTFLVYSAVIGSVHEGEGATTDNEADQERRMLMERQRWLRDNMRRTLQGIQALAEQTASGR
jgi:nitroreductase